MPNNGNYNSEIKKLGKSLSSLFKMGLEDVKRGIDFASSAIWEGKAPAKDVPVKESFPDKVEPWAEAAPASAAPEVIHVAPLTREVVEELVGPIDGIKPLDPAATNKVPEEEPSAGQDDAKSNTVLVERMDAAAVRAFLDNPDLPKAQFIGPANPSAEENAMVYAALTVNLGEGGYHWAIAGVACYEGPGGHILARDLRRLDLSCDAAAQTEAEAYREGLTAIFAAVDASYDIHLMIDGQYVYRKLAELRKKVQAGAEVKGVWADLAQTRQSRQHYLQIIEKFDEHYNAYFVR